MLSQALIYFPSIIGIFAIALFVATRSTQAVFRLFSIFAGAFGIWLILQFLIDAHIGNGNVWIRLVSIISFALAELFLLFTYTFPGSFKIRKKQSLFLLAPLIIVAGLSVTSLLIKGVVYKPVGVEFEPGPLYLAENIVIIAYLVTGLIILGRHMRRTNRAQREQIILMIIAFVVPVVGNILAGLVFVNSQYWQMARPLSILIMVCVIAYAMIYRKLFDIRTYVVRAVTYTSLLVLIGSTFVLLTVLPTIYVFHAQISGGVLAYICVVNLILIFSFGKFRSYFNRITNKIFFRDYYETQEFFNELNQILVSTLDLKLLVGNSLNLIERTLKTSFCVVVLNHGKSKKPYIISTDNKAFTVSDITVAYDNYQRGDELQNVIVTDYLTTKKDELLGAALKSNDVALFARLGKSVGDRKELGYILIGPKKSGNPYTSQDVKVIEAVANELVIAVQNALRFEEIEQFNLTLQRKIEDATRQLRRTNEKLKALDETKDDFISMASHQLRTPLTSIKGYLSMVLEGDAGKLTTTERKMLSQAFASSQRMVYLISDLLNVSRLKTGKFVINAEPINLAEVIVDEIGQLKATAATRSVTLTYNKPAHFPKLMFDETKTRQVIMNFVDNAIYYTPAGGHISVNLIDRPATIELRVEDDGIGVPKTEQHHLFTKFYRARNARKARPDGTGLGLFMAKKVVIAQGGSILFDSHEGKGSTFGFVFSKHMLAPTPAPSISTD